MDATQPNDIMQWASQVEPEGFAPSKAKLESDRFIADFLARHVRVAQGCIDAVNSVAMDETDDLDS